MFTFVITFTSTSEHVLFFNIFCCYYHRDDHLAQYCVQRFYKSLTDTYIYYTTVDAKKLFGMCVGTALRALCLEEPSVAITSSSTSALSSNTSLHQESNEDLDSCSGIYDENESRQSSSKASTRRNSDIETHRLDLIERRRIAESLADASTFSPRTAMSLGLSSLSLR